MAGSPIKALRKAGHEIPNLGEKPPRGSAPARVRDAEAVPVPPDELPDSNQIALECVGALLGVCRGSVDSRAKVAAASRLLDFFGTQSLLRRLLEPEPRSAREILESVERALPGLRTATSANAPIRARP